MDKVSFFNKNIQRRKLIQWTSVGFVALFLTSKPWNFLFSLLSKGTEIQPTPESHAFVDFHASCAALLGIPLASLDTQLAFRFWTTLISDSSTKTQLLQLSRELGKRKNRETPLKNLNELPAPVHAIAQRVLQVWYTGVITVNSSLSKRVVYQESLMFALFPLLRPTPGNCGGPFGFWTDRPARPSGDILT